jgi:serine protease Do
MYIEPFDSDVNKSGDMNNEKQTYSEQPQHPHNNYGWYSYDPRYRPIPEPAPPNPPKRKGGLLMGIFIGLTVGLVCAVLVAAPLLRGDLPREQAAPSPITPSSPSPTPFSDDSVSIERWGGGTATLEIIPVIPIATPTPQADAVGRMPLTNAQIVAKGQPSTVCILVEHSRTRSTGSGSGIIMTDDGYIITNNHVVEGASKIEVVLYNKERYSAVIIGTDHLSDLAIIKIPATGLTAAEFGDSNALMVGDPVVVIGNPLGLELQGTATSGMISAIDRDIEIGRRVMTTLQTDASVNHGNSGGPMFNHYGQVVGIISSKVMGNVINNVEGLGFAIPITPAKEVIDDLIRLGYVAGRPMIGITDFDNITASMARYSGVPQGVHVKSIHEGSDAFKQGLRVNDIIVEANGQTIINGDELNAIRNQFVVGDDFTVKVYRNRQYIEITFKLMESGLLR